MDVAYLHPFLSSIKEKAANVERVKSALATESAAEEGGAVAGDPPFPYCLTLLPRSACAVVPLEFQRVFFPFLFA